MVKGLLGKKLNMTQTFDRHGRAQPVTKIGVTPNVVLQVKDVEKDGYKSAQIGVGVEKKPLKPSTGHAKISGLDTTPKYMREIEIDGEVKPGELVTLDQVFNKGNFVDISGLSKGKG